MSDTAPIGPAGQDRPSVLDAVVQPRNPAELSSIARHAAHGRAGRDVRVATAVGLGLGGVVIASVVVYRPVFVVLVVLLVCVGCWELASVFRRADLVVPVLPVVVGATAMIVSAWYADADGLVVALTLTIVVVIGWVLTGRTTRLAADLTASVFLVAYVPLLASFAVLLARPDDGPWRVLTFVILVVCSDLGGFVVGVRLGKHPMAPSVSPKKSWEGFAGSLVSCVIGGIALAVLVFDGPWWNGAALGLAAVTSATLGDLGESAIKRDLGVKDVSGLLPGHGGVMDRLDSLLTTAPVVWVLLTAMFAP